MSEFLYKMSEFVKIMDKHNINSAYRDYKFFYLKPAGINAISVYDLDYNHIHDIYFDDEYFLANTSHWVLTVDIIEQIMDVEKTQSLICKG